MQNIAHNKARVIDDPIGLVVAKWLRAGLRDVRSNLASSLIYGVGLSALGWGILLFLLKYELAWVLLPLIAGAMLVGPLASLGFYRISRRSQGQGGGGIASPGQVALLGVILMVFALTWIRAATLIFAIFFGLMPFSGFLETMATLIFTPQGIATVVVGMIVGGLFAALGFAVSVFSIPMLLEREMDCFSAMGLSFNATTRNFWLMVVWGAVVSILVLLSVITGLIGLILTFPLLGYATWHAYCDIFKGEM